MNVKKCPVCARYNANIYTNAKVRKCRTEVLVAAYCPDCGYSWHIIYVPDRTVERK